MHYQKFAPAQQLASYIECYYIWESDLEDTPPLKVESPPPAFTSIVFNYGDDYFVSSSTNDEQKVPRQFIVGQQTQSYTLQLPGKIGMAGIVFKPTGIAALLKVPMFVLTGERIDLSVFVRPQKVEAIACEILNASCPQQKALVLENFMYSFCAENKPVPDVIDRAANLIVEKHGLININELCKKLFISQRSFERKFLQKVGLSAKYYARLRRIGYICMQMAGKKEVNWQELYYTGDFCDQSHFIKDFTEFTGRSPSDYLATNKELIHHLK
ncbi:MAG: helix-turn-helix domain-containing protein [Bacteroidota bacterium]|nr:helix-turn-helix domain-containing protein [Bacteroidota bacterium]